MENAFTFHPFHPQALTGASPFGTKAIASESAASNRPEPARSRFIKYNNNDINRNPHPSGLTKDEIPRLQARWIEEISDITGPIPLRLPPLREVNHYIHLIDPSKPIRHRYAKCPDSLRPLLMDKIEMLYSCWMVGRKERTACIAATLHPQERRPFTDRR
jgi:hypothetical protein